MKTVAFILALCALSPAQTKPDIQLPSDTRLYVPKNPSMGTESVAISVHNIIGNVAINWDGVARAFVIHSRDPQMLDMAEALLKRYDVPPPKVQLTVYLVLAVLPGQRTTDTSPSSTSGAPTSPVPAEIKSAIDEMNGTFNYNHYGLWDSIVLPIKSAGEVQGILPSNQVAPSVYTVSYNTAGPLNGSGTLSLAEFMFSLKFAGIDSHIKSDLTIREGEKLVLGKIRMLNSNADLFLVLTTKVY
ncbi:MAG TPA: hypothetical protein VMB03_04710 [Bryobacteraceae bacterium]|nr:hypothetical protein [Bryobacteraceae bacterium]